MQKLIRLITARANRYNGVKIKLARGGSKTYGLF